jgi:hypothetical protein
MKPRDQQKTRGEFVDLGLEPMEEVRHHRMNMAHPIFQVK